VCGTISLPASIVSVSSGTSGHAPVQAFQRLHRGYLIRQFYCFRSSPRGPGVSVGVQSTDPLPHRGPMSTPLRETANSAPSNGPSRSRRTRYNAISVDRAPLTGRCRTNRRSPRPTDRQYFSRCLRTEIKTGGGDNSHSLFSRETFIGTGKRDQVIVGQKLIFSLAPVGLF
jgi:hypothetical protein